MEREKGRGERARPAEKPAGAVTAQDVANFVGVSQATVSRAFTPGGKVSAPLRERVMTAARELGYQPNILARGLTSGRSNLVAMLIEARTNLLYPELLYEVSERLAEQGYHVLLFTTGADRSIADVADRILSHRVDAALTTAAITAELAERFDERGIPLVLFNRVLEAQASAICCNYREGARSMVGRLLAGGHRRFGIISGPSSSYIGEEAVAGAVTRLAAAGIDDPVIVRLPYVYSSAGPALDQVKAAMGGLPDALVCVNDAVALGCIDRLRAEGIGVPDKVSVTGFGVVNPAQGLNYQLTFTRQPVERMVAAAVDLLLARIEDPTLPAEQRFFFGEFQAGRTARLG
ncbi:LacI family DNA-binding transcriptional regulator [Niveispirillum fermenti]|uniref:LacI family DNA-binding transcriptional regulator n=1 Tax=Niveispirillum fermenti TaxID=1233113 RepID=UPI003A8985AE